MIFFRTKHSICFKTVAIIIVCLLLLNDLSWAIPQGYNSSTLAAESRLKPFFEKHRLDFKNLFLVHYVAGKLREAITAGDIRDGEIMRLNRSFPNGEVGIEKDTGKDRFVETAYLESTGREYKYIILNFKEEDKKIKVVFPAGPSTLNVNELLELGIKTGKDKDYFTGSGLKGVWFINPNQEQEPPAEPHRPIQPVDTESQDDLTLEEIDSRMQNDGFPEMEKPWKIFKKTGVPLEEVDDAKVERMHLQHINTLISHPILTFVVCALLAIVIYAVMQWGVTALIEYSIAGTVTSGFSFEFLKNPGELFFWAISGGFIAAALAVYIQRYFIHSWKKVIAVQIASMLKKRNFRAWFDSTERVQKTVSRLQKMELNDNWDNPQYRVHYTIRDGKIKEKPIQSPDEYVQMALREVLGYKENRRYRPGRYINSLKRGKKSVTRFVNTYNEQIKQNKAGDLPIEDGLVLLRNLQQEYLVPGSAGDKYVSECIAAIERKDQIVSGVIEAKIWGRDPWVDLTNEKDFFSSASLRGFKISDGRSKGRLGTFGYLRNKSISALDFSTKDGRSVRVRMAAATYKDREGNDRPLLFVDGVEGSFDIKPRIIKRAVEDYARSCGFDLVFYFRYPLNKVPQRFISYVKNTGAELEEISISYADYSHREYLDSFGFPFEPFEYAFPRGKVVGYAVEMKPDLIRKKVIPGLLVTGMYRARYMVLPAMAIAASIYGGVMVWQYAPSFLIPYASVVGGMFLYDTLRRRRSLKKRLRAIERGEEVEGPVDWYETVPQFIKKIRKEILADPIAQKMNYQARLDEKIRKLLFYFPSPQKELRYFFEEVLFNVSIKESALENVLKFMKKLNNDNRKTAAQLCILIWSTSSQEGKQTGLSEDKKARDELKKQLFDKIGNIRKFSKIDSLTKKEMRQIKLAKKYLKLDVSDILEMVLASPKILRGLWKPPRPIYAWIAPALAAAITGFMLVGFFPSMSTGMIYLITMTIVVAGTYVISMHLPVAPGILRYKKTRKFFSEIIKGERGKTAIEENMEALRINVDEYEKEKTYQDGAKGIRVVIRDKKTLDGAVKFLTSNEEIGSCITLRNFVSWTLPSLLDDDSIMLADVYYKGGHSTYVHRSQIWMVAAEENGEPVLVVNSFEFNKDGAKYINELLPASIEVLRDVARRAGFKKIYAGITEYGRSYLDNNFKQGQTKADVKKVHASEAGYTYYFDVFGLRRKYIDGRFRKQYVYLKKRSLITRIYALVYGLREVLKGNRAKALAFFDTIRNTNNFWEIRLEAEEDEGAVGATEDEGGKRWSYFTRGTVRPEDLEKFVRQHSAEELEKYARMHGQEEGIRRYLAREPEKLERFEVLVARDLTEDVIVPVEPEQVGIKKSKELLVLISNSDPSAHLYDMVAFRTLVCLYWRLRGYKIKIIKKATSDDLRQALLDPAIRNIAVTGHGDWSGWRASDRWVKENTIERWMSSEVSKKDMFVKYMCGHGGMFEERIFGYHAVKDPDNQLFGTMHEVPGSWWFDMPGLFSLKTLREGKSIWLKFLSSRWYSRLQHTFHTFIAFLSVSGIITLKTMIFTGVALSGSLWWESAGISALIFLPAFICAWVYHRWENFFRTGVGSSMFIFGGIAARNAWNLIESGDMSYLTRFSTIGWIVMAVFAFREAFYLFQSFYAENNRTSRAAEYDKEKEEIQHELTLPSENTDVRNVSAGTGKKVHTQAESSPLPLTGRQEKLERAADSEEPETPFGVAKKEADKVHDESLKYTPIIPEKTILCHIIIDSILPEGQRDMLHVLKQDMIKRDEWYIERVIRLNINDSKDFVQQVKEAIAEYREERKDQDRNCAYEFDVACPGTEHVEAILNSDLDVKALAFEPCKEPAQAEGIILALRALHTERIDTLRRAFEFLANRKLSAEELLITGIDQFVKKMTFILPPVKALNYREARRLNEIIKENIKTAA